jgi:hypothetical protein
MIDFIFRINHWKPSDNVKQKDYVTWDKRLSKNWATELQISRMPLRDIFELHVGTTWLGGDHAGPRFNLTILWFFFDFRIYNVNHWNWEEGRFYTKEEALAEWEDDLKFREKNNLEDDPDDKYAVWKEKEFRLWKDTVYPTLNQKEKT